MKKLLAILLSIVLVFTFSACQSEDETTTTQTTTTQTSTTQTTTSNQTTTAVTMADVTIEDQTTSQEVNDETTTSTQADEIETTSTSTTNSTPTTSSTTTTKAQTTATTTNSTTTTTPATAASSTTTTTAATTTTKATTTAAQNYCYVTIDMTTALDNLSAFSVAKASFIPSSGILLEKTKVYYTDGDTLFDAILAACSDNVCSDNCKYCQSGGIQIEYQYTPAYNSYYIEGVHQIYEMDGGVMSGWMVYVNNQAIASSASTIEIQNGDNIILAYTCSMGSDINF